MTYKSACFKLLDFSDTEFLPLEFHLRLPFPFVGRFRVRRNCVHVNAQQGGFTTVTGKPRVKWFRTTYYDYNDDTLVTSLMKWSDPMNGTAEVCLTLTEGPICGLGDAGIEVSSHLWDSIIATESFPPGAGASGANYVLRLNKEVSHASEVRHVEDELMKALQMLAAAWPFSGGSYLIIETRETVRSPRFESNANGLEREMLARSGLTRVISEVRMPLGWSGTYSQAPLCAAASIVQSMHSDFPTRRLLFYHQGAVIARGNSSWFVSLYKVRDFLCKRYHGAEKAKKALNITEGWSDFGTMLNNNDLRHAEITGNVPSISNGEIDKLYQLARCWVASYLRIEKSLPALG